MCVGETEYVCVSEKEGGGMRKREGEDTRALEYSRTEEHIRIKTASSLLKGKAQDHKSRVKESLRMLKRDV